MIGVGGAVNAGTAVPIPAKPKAPLDGMRSSARELDEICDTVPASTTLDAFLGGAIYLRQPKRGYRAGTDAVLLAAAVGHQSRRDGASPVRLIDVGAGVGAVGLLAATRLAQLDVTLLERDRSCCELANANIEAASLDRRARVIRDDVAAPILAGQPELPENGFDVAVSNPPFYSANDHRRSPEALKAGAHALPEAGLDLWLRFMARMTRSGGTLLLIYPADRLPALLCAVMPRFGSIVVQPLHARAGEPAHRVIVRAIKGSRGPACLAPGLVVHGPDHRFMPDIDCVLKSPAPLPGRLATE